MAQSDDQIDLLEFFAKGIFQIKKNAKLIIFSFIIGTTLGFCFYSYSAKVYESKMMVLSDILTSSYSERITENLNNLISEKNTKVLSERLDMPEEEVRQIAKIEIESVKLEKVKDEVENATFIVTVKTLNKDIFPILQEKIVNYLRNNEYVKIRVEQRKKYTNSTISKIDEELLSLESLKSRIAKGEPLHSGNDNLVLFDPTSVNTKILDLTKEKVNLQNSLEIINSIQLVEGFTIFEKPVSPKLSFSLAGGASLGLFFVAIVIGIKLVRKMLSFSQERLGKS